MQACLWQMISAGPSRYVRSEEIGWGGRIRTSTILINSEVSYRLDHAPAAFVDPDCVRVSRKWVAPLQNRAAGVLLRYHARAFPRLPFRKNLSVHSQLWRI